MDGVQVATVNNFADLNYLAHFYLAYPEIDLTFGNYIGDGVRGAQVKNYSEAVQRGVRFHRFIDTYTDTHEEVRQAKQYFRKSQAKFAGVVLDVWFDYLLATHWERYCDISLKDFAQLCYDNVGQHPEPMPIRSERFYGYMVSNDVLMEYQDIEGIRTVFRGMDSRTKFPSRMMESVADFEAHQLEIEKHFAIFFPALKSACQAWIKEN